MTLKMAHRALLRVLWCERFSLENWSGLLFAEDASGGAWWT
jgi:hypothetical protein